MTTTVINIRNVAVPDLVPGYVYVGRPSKWGNPFRSGCGMSREQAVESHRQFLLTHPELLNEIRTELKDRVLGCFCHPKLCHAHTLARVADGGQP